MAEPPAGARCSLVELHLELGVMRDGGLDLRWLVRRQPVYPRPLIPGPDGVALAPAGDDDVEEGRIAVPTASLGWIVRAPRWVSRRGRIELLTSLLESVGELDALLRRLASDEGELLRVAVVPTTPELSRLPWEAAVAWLLQARRFPSSSWGVCRRSRAGIRPTPISLPLTVAVDEALDAARVAPARSLDAFVEETFLQTIALPHRGGPAAAIVHVAAEHLGTVPACRLLVVHAVDEEAVERVAVEAEPLAWHALLVLPREHPFEWRELYRALMDDLPLDRAVLGANRAHPFGLGGALLVLRPGAETDLLLSRILAEDAGLLPRAARLVSERQRGEAPRVRGPSGGLESTFDSDRGREPSTPDESPVEPPEHGRARRIVDRLRTMVASDEQRRLVADLVVGASSGLASDGLPLPPVLALKSSWPMLARTVQSLTWERLRSARALAELPTAEARRAQVRYTTASLWHGASPDAEQRVTGFVVVGEPVTLRVAVDAEVEQGMFAAAFPDDRLRELVPELRPVELTVLLFFEDRHFEGPRRATLLLPPTGSARDPARFSLVPRMAGTAPLRIGLYYRNVLLQSVAMQATVREAGSAVASEEGPEAAPRFQLDWAATDDLALLHELDERQPGLCLFVNEQAGTHWIGLRTEQSSTLDGRLRTFEHDAIVQRAELARAALHELHRIPRARGKPNAELSAAERERWEQKLVELARVGRRLYRGVLELSDDDPGPVTSLDAAPGPPRVTIARVSSQAPAFPWAMLYERPLDPFEARVCPRAWEALQADSSATPPCASDPICSAHPVEQTVCPHGFWGLRYVLEQPLGRTRLDPTQRPLAVGEEVEVERQPSAAYCYDDTLDRTKAHAEAIAQALGDLELRRLSDIEDVHRALTREEASIYYFLCHGEHRNGSFVLKLRKGNAPRDLHAEDLEPHRAARPFIAIINACESVAAREDVLNDLIAALRQLGAVAVVGTEIEIQQDFAQRFGVRLVQQLAQGRSMGEALLQLRRETMAQGLDASGLAYTAYGSASVRLR